MKSAMLLGAAAAAVGASAAAVTALAPELVKSNRMSVHDVLTTNYLPMRPVVSTHGSPAALRRRIAAADASLETRQTPAAPHAPANIKNVRDIYYVIDIQLGDQSIPVSVDTGSSDTWFIGHPLACVDFFYITQPEARCGFGKGFEGNFSGGMIDDDVFTRAYVDGTFVLGTYGYSDITVGGITVPHQQLALVNYTFWYGEGLTSGLMGLAYPLMTGLDGGGNPRDAYDPIFTSMWKRDLIGAPLFSMALSRYADNSTTAAAAATEMPAQSYLAFGGIPPVDFDDASWASAPILGINEISSIESDEPGLFIIKADAYVYGPGNKGLTTSSGTPPEGLVVNATQFPVLIDCGATLTRLPTPLAEAVFAAFDPPAHYVRHVGLYYAPCNATAPTFGVKVGGQTYYMSPHDLLRQTETDSEDPTMCRVGIEDDDSGPWVLGITFLTNVLAVFDIGKREMRFASRTMY